MVESGIWRATLTDSAGGDIFPRQWFVRARVVQLYDSSPDPNSSSFSSFSSHPSPYLFLPIAFFEVAFQRRPYVASKRNRFHVNRRTCLATTVTTRKFSMHPAPSFHLALKVSSTAILFSQRLRFMHR